MRRRAVLGSLFGTGLATTALAGCAGLTDPVVHGTGDPAATVAPGPAPRFALAAARLHGHAGRLRGWSGDADWAEAVARMLDSQAAVLMREDPFSGEALGGLTVTPASPAATDEKAFASAAADLADGLATSCRKATEPLEAMLWASLSSAVRLNASPGPSPVARALPHRVALTTAVDARNVALGHLHSQVLWLEMAMGRANRVERALLGRQLDALQGQVRDQHQKVRSLGGEPVAPLPGYEWPGPATDRSTFARLQQRVFEAFAPVVALTAPGRRAPALDEMVAFGRQAVASGTGTSFFPGWVA